MRRRETVLVAAFLASVAACVFAAEPWKSKDYEKWTSKEVEKILNDSPWAHQMTSPHAPHEGGAVAEAGGSTTGNDPLHAQDSTSRTENGFILRWNSSNTVRRALYRQAVLKGTDPAAAKESYLDEADTDDYQLVLISAAKTILPWNDTQPIKQEAYLEFEPSKTRVSPATAKVEEMVDARGHRGFAFWFPKQTDGKATIPEGTVSVVFHMHIGSSTLVAAFKPGEMIGADGPDVQ